MKPLESLFSELSQPRKIVITTHPNPDADALGSSLGLGHFLDARGHSVTIITPTDYPDFLEWMPGNESVLVYREETDDEVRATIDKAEIIFCLDFSSTHRLKAIEPMILGSTAIKVLIDHHLDPQDFTDFQLWDIKAAATAELVYDLIVMMDARSEITPDIANCLYAGIMTDTGSFKHPSTTAKVHTIVADLIKLGANVNYVSREIYDTNSLSRLRFLGYALSELLTVKEDLQVAYLVVSANDYEKFQLKSGDTEGIVNYALSIKGVVMATIIIEREEEVKLSFRSVGNYSVNTFANKYFNGGGHKNASGGVSYDDLKTTLLKFESLIQTYKETYQDKA
jgi:phosphoesterase RecJ-like protein